MTALEIRAYTARPLTLLSSERFSLPAAPPARGMVWLTASTGMVHALRRPRRRRQTPRPSCEAWQEAGGRGSVSTSTPDGNVTCVGAEP